MGTFVLVFLPSAKVAEAIFGSIFRFQMFSVYEYIRALKLWQSIHWLF